MKEIPLTQGKFALVDDEDYEWLSQWKWSLGAGKYAVRVSRVGESPKSTMIYMHRALLNPGPRVLVDHVNGDGLDNRRSNLRACTQAENLRNRGPNANNTTGYKGVGFSKRKCRDRPWNASLALPKRGSLKSKKFLGHFATPEEAARAYDAAALKYHGEFARLNFPVTAPRGLSPA